LIGEDGPEVLELIRGDDRYATGISVRFQEYSYGISPGSTRGHSPPFAWAS
jgi:hypothetical protein